MTSAADSDNSTFSDCSAYSTSFAYNPPVQHSHLFEHLVLVLVSINIVECVVSSCSNFIVIYTISATASLRRTPSNILIIGLAISDLVVSLVALPSFSFHAFSTERHQIYCITSIVFSSVNSIFSGISLFTLTAITIDRFLAVQLHLRYQELVTIKRYVLVLVGVWVYSTCSTMLKLFLGRRRFNFVLAFVELATFVPLNMTLIFQIYRVIRRHSLQIHAQHQSVQQSIDMPRYRKSVNTMYLVIGAFLVCYVPFAAALLLPEELYRTHEGQFLFVLVCSFVLFNSVLNPIIYFWRIEEIRNNAVRLLRRMWKRNEHEMEP